MSLFRGCWKLRGWKLGAGVGKKGTRVYRIFLIVSNGILLGSSRQEGEEAAASFWQVREAATVGFCPACWERKPVALV